MINYLLDLFSKIYNTPVIIKITKTSIMGNVINKTFDYYRNIKIKSILPEEFTITYITGFNIRRIRCDTESYDEAIFFIKTYDHRKHRLHKDAKDF